MLKPHPTEYAAINFTKPLLVLMLLKRQQNLCSMGVGLEKGKKRGDEYCHKKLDETGAFLERSPRKTLTHVAAQSGMSLGSAHTTTRCSKLQL
jgi:hypothetical protein